jgi:hypothetical protein
VGIGLSTIPVAASNGAGNHFTATYANGSTTWTCSGTHVANKVIKDVETCLVTGDTTGYVAGTYTGTEGAYAPCADGNFPPSGTRSGIPTTRQRTAPVRPAGRSPKLTTVTAPSPSSSRLSTQSSGPGSREACRAVRQASQRRYSRIKLTHYPDVGFRWPCAGNRS